MDFIEKVWAQTIRLQCRTGSYAVWNSNSGASLWLQLDKKNQLVGLTPFFNGNSEVIVGITSQIKRSDDTELEGAIYGWADPSNGKPEDGAYPFVFDYINFGQLPRLKCPTIRKVNIVAFAHEINFSESEEKYYSTQNNKPGFASKSFIPSGTFSLENGKKDTPDSEAIFTGHIIESKFLKNEITNVEYYYIKVATLGGAYDIVADKELVNSEIVVGGIVTGSFYLCGKLILEKKSILGNFV